MSKTTPGTVSKILWHFTGGPIWDEGMQKQSSELKSDMTAYQNLSAIIRSQKLKASQYTEFFTTSLPMNKVPTWDALSKELTVQEAEEAGKINFHFHNATSKVVCLADIPIQHLPYHAKRYGKFGIGFRRELILNADFNPVMYLPTNSTLNSAIHGAFSRLNFYTSQISEHDQELESLLQDTRLCFLDILSMSKTFHLDEFETVYCEREWRKTSDFNFSTENISMIILPRQTGHFEQFMSDFPEFPRTIPVIPWEDLLEH
ncbi:abortive infection system antitoxin AbiGi family protein [Rheinheimera faecalis]|jgi:hypothetical protein